MRTIKLFVWFTTHSWTYMAGQRHHFFTGFVRAWRHFNGLNRQKSTRKRFTARMYESVADILTLLLITTIGLLVIDAVFVLFSYYIFHEFMWLVHPAIPVVIAALLGGVLHLIDRKMG